MDTTTKTFVYNNTHHMQYIPKSVETSKAATTASHYFGKAVEVATSAATYVSESGQPLCGNTIQ